MEDQQWKIGDGRSVVEHDWNPRDLINFIAISERIPPGTVRSVRRMTLG
jgi:hypothetical protein